ncbi:hypothetical protein [Xanthomonas medicagonis]|uniref:hypothetical protein n=1 Tax=Xanthomonas medicagonis TaxID=3160841 RepID=UPI00351396B0
MRNELKRRIRAVEATAMRSAARPPISAADLAMWAAVYNLTVDYGHLVEQASQVQDAIRGPSDHWMLGIQTITPDMTPNQAAEAYAATLRGLEIGPVPEPKSVSVGVMVDFIEAVGRIDPEAEKQFWRQTDLWDKMGSSDARTLAEIHGTAGLPCPFPPPPSGTPGDRA